MTDIVERLNNAYSVERLNELYEDAEYWSDASLYSDAADEIERLRGALKRIAAFEDEGASAFLAKTGSHSLFDEPGSVAIARAALSGKE